MRFFAAQEHLRILAQLLLRDDVGVLRRLHERGQLAELLLAGQKHAGDVPSATMRGRYGLRWRWVEVPGCESVKGRPGGPSDAYLGEAESGRG